MKIRQMLDIIDVQARMDLKAEASVLYLSYLWWVLEPLLFVLVFYTVFEVLLDLGREDFLLFLVCGKIPFLWFSKSITNASNSIVKNRGLIGLVDMPKVIFPYISIQQTLYKQWVVFLVLFAVVILYGLLPEINWLWLMPLIVVQYLLIVLCSMIGALLVSFFLDFRNIIAMLMLFMMFSSGIFWDINAIADPQLREAVMVLNPLAFLIDGYRQVLMYQSIYNLQHLAWLGGACLLGVIFMHRVFNNSSRAIAAQIIKA